MPWRVNTTHTMGVDVIDKTVGWGEEEGDPLTQNHWTGVDFSVPGGHAVTPAQNSLEFGGIGECPQKN